MAKVNPFYRSAEWRAIRKMQLARQPECRRCGSRQRLQVDHVRPISKGGAKLDLANLQTLCIHCHAAKTYRGAPPQGGGRKPELKGASPEWTAYLRSRARISRARRRPH